MSSRRVTSLLFVVLLACCPLAGEAQEPANCPQTVQTSSGPVCGTTSSASITESETVTARVYRGIPYAEPPTGARRWQYATLFQGSELLQATAYGNECPQTVMPPTAAGDQRTLGTGESEDCLFLNLWVPEGTTASSQLPVMVFIHGGNFDQGSGNAPGTSNLYDGTYLAATGNVIVVTFNYRLGALGFLPHGGNYNFGFADQILALQWVQKNVGNFGGDPQKVMLFGQSAGAKSVGLHTLVSPVSAGLFQAALMESNAIGLYYRSSDEVEELRREFCAQDVSLCTTAASACDVVAAQNGFLQAQPLSFSSISNLTWTPVVDDVYITGQPIAAAADLRVPLLLGTNRDEGPSFVYPAEGMAPKSASNPPGPEAYAAILDQQFGVEPSQRIRSFDRYRCGTASDCSKQLVNVMTDFAFTCANRHFALEATKGEGAQPLYIYQFDHVSSFNIWDYGPTKVPQCNCLVCHLDEVIYVFNTAWQSPSDDKITFTPAEVTLAQTFREYWTSFARSLDPGGGWPLFKPKSSYLLLNESSSTSSDPLDAVANCSTLWDGIGYGLPLPGTPMPPPPPPQDFVLYGGDVVTLDEAGTVAEAVWVRDGRIEAVGSRAEVRRHATPATELVDLGGSTVLPGFVDPHLHLDITTVTSFFTDVNPCLPERYETRAKCPLYISDALAMMQQDPKPAGSQWIVGNGLDPSLMPLDETRPASVFQADPARYIDQYVSQTRPVFILDKSAHLAYVNLQAFVAAGICESVENCSQNTAKTTPPVLPAKWVTAPDGSFTGLLVESGAFAAFGASIPQPSPAEFVDRAEGFAREFARAGVTTMANGGTVTTQVPYLQALAARSRNRPMLRYRALVPWYDSQGVTHPSPWDESNPLFGITGIKFWADGSTQGCTAALVDPYDERGQCSTYGTGVLDFETGEIVSRLQPFWQAGWPIQIHVNGDGAIRAVLAALATLQAQTRNASPITLLHFTVDGNPAKGEDMVQQVAELRAGRFDGKRVPPIDLRVSHLIGHVAYWGGALEGILDGVSGPGQADESGRAARLDATRRDLELGVPFSLHSDAPVTPTRPLWYVEQAVTRNTWFYPHLKDADVHTLPGAQNVTIDHALRAVTIEPARQHGLDRYVGSIEKGKVADLVILDKNPLEQLPNEIHQIRVLSTFVGGYRNDWQAE